VWRNEETLWTEVLAHFPMSGVANLHYAAELASQRRFAEALPHAEIAAQVFPDTGLGHSTLGLIRLKLGDTARALNELKEAIRREPKLVAPRYNLACAYARLGRFGEACDTLQELARIDPQMLSFAARDSEFTALRADPRYGERLRQLLSSSR
jgi:tetratricopeptide (TPR) repeat protein